MSNIYYCSASVGAGKTTALTKSRDNNITIYAAPTVALAIQTHKALTNSTLVVSEQSACGKDMPEGTRIAETGNITQYIDNEISKLKTGDTLCVTHSALLNYISDTNTRSKSKCAYINLVIDEELQSIKRNTFTPSAESRDEFLNFINFDTDTPYKAQIVDATQEEVAEFQMFLNGQNGKDQHLNAKRFDPFLESIIKEYTTSYVIVKENRMTIVDILNPQILCDLFEKVTCLVAAFEYTMFYAVCQYLHGMDMLIDWEIEKYIEVSMDKHRNGKFMDIYHLLPEDQKASHTMLKDRTESAVITLGDAIKHDIAIKWSSDFVYSSHDSWYDNGRVSDFDVLENVQRMPSNPAGMNNFADYTRLACLMMCQYSDDTLNELSLIFQCDKEYLNNTLRVATTYQIIGRCAVRKHYDVVSTLGERIEIVVLDKGIADQIADIFTGAVVKGHLGKASREIGKVGPKKKNDWTSSDKTFMKRQKKVFNDDPSRTLKPKAEKRIRDLVSRSETQKLSDYGLGE